LTQIHSFSTSWQRVGFCGFEFFVPARLAAVPVEAAGAAAAADTVSEGTMRFRGSQDETMVVAVAAPQHVRDLILYAVLLCSDR
jgi:hypothetical protein